MSGMEQLLVENRVFNPPKEFAKQAAITSMDQYKAMCKAFDKDFNGTWARLAKERHEFRPLPRPGDYAPALPTLEKCDLIRTSLQGMCPTSTF